MNANQNISIDVEFEDDLPGYVVGDQQRLRQVLLNLLFTHCPTTHPRSPPPQVLLNLLFNAVKFTPQGKITVSAAVQQEFASHLRLHFAVEDTGIGIRADDTQKLFGLFSKIRDNRVQNPLGVGLGLAICKQLVELMRGQIHVSSVYGKAPSSSSR